MTARRGSCPKFMEEPRRFDCPGRRKEASWIYFIANGNCELESWFLVSVFVIEANGIN